MITSLINRKEAKKLFKKECVYMGYADVIPLRRVMELFGSSPVRFILDKGRKIETGGKYYNLYAVNGCYLAYLTWEGYTECVAYHNAQILLADENAPVLNSFFQNSEV